jgi:hypothetical protein
VGLAVTKVEFAGTALRQAQESTVLSSRFSVSESGLPYKNYMLRNLPLPYYHGDGDLRRTCCRKELKDPCYGIKVLMITYPEQMGRAGEVDDDQCHNIWCVQSRPRRSIPKARLCDAIMSFWSSCDMYTGASLSLPSFFVLQPRCHRHHRTRRHHFQTMIVFLLLFGFQFSW